MPLACTNDVGFELSLVTPTYLPTGWGYFYIYIPRLLRAGITTTAALEIIATAYSVQHLRGLPLLSTTETVVDGTMATHTIFKTFTRSFRDFFLSNRLGVCDTSGRNVHSCIGSVFALLLLYPFFYFKGVREIGPLLFLLTPLFTRSKRRTKATRRAMIMVIHLLGLAPRSFLVFIVVCSKKKWGMWRGVLGVL